MFVSVSNYDHGFPMPYVVDYFYVQWFEIRGGCSFC